LEREVMVLDFGVMTVSGLVVGFERKLVGFRRRGGCVGVLLVEILGRRFLSGLLDGWRWAMSVGIKIDLLWAISYGEVVSDLESDFRFLMVALFR
jgi:hypothetical protein